MNEIDNEKAILEEAPDFDNQIRILEEEHEAIVKKRKWYILIASIFLFIVLIFVVSYSTIYHYREYGSGHGHNNCDNVNLKVNGSPVPNLNITDGNNCKPIYNIDYFNNRKPTFNIDIYGDRSFIFNKTNQLDATGSYCILNCDSNNDGWPDYNLDLNGDGIADVNIVNNPKNNTKCDLNCDLNYDTIPDINIDIDNDGIADINITDNNSDVPKYNVDYKGNRKPTFNINKNGIITNTITDIKDNPNCEKNCDVDGDGWPDYNIILDNSNTIINQVIKTEDSQVTYENIKIRDWKCIINPNLKGCTSKIKVNNNTYINIDIDGDGIADVNISSDGGQTITNPINKDNKTLNIDSNNDGWPDYNIDINGDGIPDLNIIKNNEYKCIKNCDTNSDGKPDYLIDYNNGSNTVSITNLNIDVDYDGICDVNCDLDFDLIPDINIDINGDNIPDINIDYDHDNIADFNLDTNKDGKPDENLDAYGNGVCTFNCNGINMISDSPTCTTNCDTNGDGWPDKNVDIDGDGICDFNCNNKTTNIDADNNYYLDTKYDPAILDVTNSKDADFYIMNPLEIKESEIEPGWNDKYVIEIKNNAYYAVAYKIVWENVTNEFTDANNLDYSLSRSNTYFLDNLKAPRSSIVLKDAMIIRNNSSARFVLDLNFRETGLNQNIDSGKTFKGQLKVEVIK